jgi:cytoskeletal protein RodZ
VESLGNKLKTARESKGYSYDYVCREINIASRYLEALEMENFSGFPGEPYILGFLRNYSEYLGLDPEELLSLYRILKIQEQSVPVEQLLKSPSPLPKIFLGIAITLAILGIIAGGVYIVFHLPRQDASAVSAVREKAEYVITNNSLERRFYQGDTILVPLGTIRYKLELSGLGETVTIATPGGNVILDLSQEKTLDLDNDGFEELRIIAEDFVKNDSSTGALLCFELSNNPSLAAGEDDAALIPAVDVPAEGPAAADNAGFANNTVIFSSPNSYPFTLQALFQGYCMFRWEIRAERDRQDRDERYFQKSDEFNIQAQNGIRIWVSNAQAVKLQVIGGGRTAPLDLGGAGEVVVADIRWFWDEENRYRLILTRLESGGSQ